MADKKNKKKQITVTQDETLRTVIPNICAMEDGKILFNLLSRFTGYHLPAITADGNGTVDPNAVIYNEGMRNVYRYIRSYMPVELMGEIEHGVYPYDVKQDSTEGDDK